MKSIPLRCVLASTLRARELRQDCAPQPQFFTSIAEPESGGAIEPTSATCLAIEGCGASSDGWRCDADRSSP
jgi:hypothetical protein